MNKLYEPSISSTAIVSLQKFCQQVGVTEGTGWRWRRNGWLSTVKICGRHYLTEKGIQEFKDQARTRQENRKYSAPNGVSPNKQNMQTQPHPSADSNYVQVPHDFRKVHPIIKSSLSILSAQAPDKYNRLTVWKNKECVHVKVSKPNLRRALLILDGLVKAMERLGHNLEVGVSGAGTCFKIGQERVRVIIIETANRRKRTDSDPTLPFVCDRYTYTPSGKLSFIIDEFADRYRPNWTETKKRGLESRLDEIFQAILDAGRILQERTLKREENERRYAEQERQRQEMERLKREEEAKIKLLEERARAWKQSQELHSFIKACEAELLKIGPIDENSPAAKWLGWAKDHASSLNPFGAGYLVRIEKLQREFLQSSPIARTE